MSLHPLRSISIITITLILTACSSSPDIYTRSKDGPPSSWGDVSQIPDAVPKKEPRSKSGNPGSYVVFGKRYYVMKSARGYKERGIASWYGSKFHGKRTSSGEPYDMHGMTAAHKTLPLPTYVKVTNLKNGRQVIVKVNDRGPFHENRIIDLSHTAAIKLGIKGTGTGLVEVEAIDPDNWDNNTRTARSSHAPVADTPSETITKIPVPKISGIFLQLGAFVSSHNAYVLKNRANNALDSTLARVSSTLNGSQKFYRVRIGPLDNVEQADSLTERLTQKGFNTPSVVID